MMDTRPPRNPLFSDNRVKIGIMAFNCSHGSTPTMVETAWKMTWPDNVALARLADAAGFEALLPVGRWKGYPGPTNFNHRTFESFTWAAGISAVTRQCAVLATVHVPLVHPVTAAKQAAIDGAARRSRHARGPWRAGIVRERDRGPTVAALQRGRGREPPGRPTPAKKAVCGAPGPAALQSRHARGASTAGRPRRSNRRARADLE